MSVPANQNNRFVYSGDGSSTSFAVNSVFETAADLLVYTWDTVNKTASLKVLNTDYTVSGGNDSNGSVLFGSAPAATLQVIIIIVPTIAQLQNIAQGGSLPPTQYVFGLDFLTLIARRLNELFTRSMVKQDYDTGSLDPHLPVGLAPGDFLTVKSDGTGFNVPLSAASRANMVLGFDASGLPVAVTPGSGGGGGTAQVLPAYSADGSYPTPTTGSAYFNTTSGTIRVYNGTSWLGVPMSQPAVLPAYSVDASYPSPVAGSTYFNTGSSTVRIYNGSSWIGISGGTAVVPAYASDGAYPTPASGSVYYNTVSGLLRVYNGSAFVSVPVGTVTIAQGGTGVTAVPTSPSASAFAAWDANKNMSASNFIDGFATTATAAGTTALTVSSASIQVFTGTTTQTVTLPAVAGLVTGQQFTIINLSTGAVTVQSSGGNTLQVLAANTQLVAICQLNTGTGTASWTWGYGPAQSGVLAIAQGGTGAATATAAFAALAPTSPVAGQVIAWNGSTWVAQTVQAGAKNYITFNNFENNATTGWSLSHTTLSNNFPNQASGSWTAAAGTLSQAIVSSGQLAGSYSNSLVSSAATTAGDMLVSQVYTIDSEDQAKVLTFKFYFSVPSGAANGNFSGSSSNSFGVAIYDSANSAWIMPAGVWGMTQNSGVGYCTGTFQTPSNMTSFRLAIFAANATSGAITLYVDDFSVGPQTAPLGPAMTDWQAYTPTLGGSGSAPTVGTTSINLAEYRRVGDTLWVRYQLKQTAAGSAGTGNYLLPLPGGLTVDASKITVDTSGFNGTVGVGNVQYTGFNGSAAYIIAYSSTQLAVLFDSGAGAESASFWGAASGGLNNVAVSVSLTAQVPITGWSSNVQMSNDTDTRVVSTNTTGTTTTFTTGGTVYPLVPTTINKDTHAGWSGSTYKIPVSGYYQFGGAVRVTTACTYAGLLWSVTGSQTVSNLTIAQQVAGSVTAGLTPSGYATYFFNAGDSLVLSGQFSASSTTVAECYLSINRLSGPAVAASTEAVYASYQCATAQSFGVNGTVVPFDTKVRDSHNAFTTGASARFTAPVSGEYEISSFIAMSGTQASAVGQFVGVNLFKNGSVYSALVFKFLETTSATGVGLSGTNQIYLLAGDYIDLRSSANTGTAAGSMSGAAANNFVSIKRIGN